MALRRLVNGRHLAHAATWGASLQRCQMSTATPTVYDKMCERSRALSTFAILRCGHTAAPPPRFSPAMHYFPWTKHLWPTFTNFTARCYYTSSAAHYAGC